MAGYHNLDFLLNEELDQLAEEGRIFDKEKMTNKIAEYSNDRQKLMELYHEMQTFPVDKNFTYFEPSDYETIVKCSSGSTEKTVIPYSDSALFDRIYGAWLGRCIGCALGQPVEGWTKEDVQTYCQKADAWPIRDYIPLHSAAEQEYNLHLVLEGCAKEVMQFMPTDDDIRFTVLGLLLLKEKGADWDSWDLGEHWLSHLPARFVFTAETQAYMNFLSLEENSACNAKPENGDALARSYASFINPYREWIGAQIRIDCYGYAAAGDPHLAAKLAYHDAAFSHVKNGIYSAMFFAAMIAAAFVESSIEKAVDRALAEIPKNTRFYEAMEKAMEVGRTALNDTDLVTKVSNLYPNYNRIHSINNSAFCVAVLLYSHGDFDRAVPLVVSCGLDTDCNGATVGSVLGALRGAEKIPDKWKLPLHDLLYSQIPDYHPIKISEVAKQTVEVFHKIND
ncbi:MAG: crystallin [Caproiciproducens sp.]|nr:crystallin [Caproiciproducens sp.]